MVLGVPILKPFRFTIDGQKSASFQDVFCSLVVVMRIKTFIARMNGKVYRRKVF